MSYTSIYIGKVTKGYMFVSTENDDTLTALVTTVFAIKIYFARMLMPKFLPVYNKTMHINKYMYVYVHKYVYALL